MKKPRSTPSPTKDTAREPRQKPFGSLKSAKHIPFHEWYLDQREKLQKETRQKLNRLYRFGYPDITKMKAGQLAHELELLYRIIGSNFMKNEWYKRFEKVRRARSYQIARSGASLD